MPNYFGQGIDSPFSAEATGFTRSVLYPGERDTKGSIIEGRESEEGTEGPRRDCRQKCRQEGLKPYTPQFEQCVKECQQGGGGGGGGGGCSGECAEMGLTPGTPEFIECVQECRGCPDGQHLENGTCVPNIVDRPCRPGFILDPSTGECVKDDQEDTCEGGYLLADDPIQGSGGSVWTDEVIKPEHGWFRDPRKQGHQVWNNTYGLQNLPDVHNFIQTGADLTPNLEASACKKGFTKKTMNGEEMCCPGNGGGNGNGGGTLGEFKFPPGMQELMDLLLGRGKDLLNMPLGLTQEEKDAMFGKGFENIQSRAGAQREDLYSSLSRSGGLGIGEREGEGTRKISRGIEEDISDAMRDLLIYGSERKKSDLLDFTGAAKGIFGSGLQYENLLEAINSGRRGESQAAFMQFLTMLMSGFFN